MSGKGASVKGFLCIADGVGDLQQGGLRSPHLSQYERVGLGVEKSDVPGVQLLTQVSDAKLMSGSEGAAAAMGCFF